MIDFQSSKHTSDISLSSKNIFQFLKTNQEILTKIYSSSFFPYTILSIFRSVSKKSQLFLLKYLFIVQHENQEFSLTFASADQFSDPKQAEKQLNYQSMIIGSVNELKEYRIVEKESTVLRFNFGFISQLRRVILEKDILKKQSLVVFNEHRDKMSDIEEGHKEKIPSKKKLERLAKEKWETVLHYMVGAVDQLRDSSIEALLKQSNLVQNISEEELKMIAAKNQTSLRTQVIEVPHIRITNQGFQFLLQDTRTQIWQLFKQYLLASEERGQDPVEVIEFLFRISFMEPGQPIKLSSLTQQEHNIVNNLSQFGILFKKKKRDRVYPTQLASGLLTAVSSLENEDSGFSAWYTQQDLDGYILVETNFRVYAYSNSPLQIQLLSLFVELDTRIPNLVSGTLTRDSVRAALVNGITADQIISYLTMHSHPEMKKNPWLVPPNIVDQIRLWEKERERVKGTDATLIESFPTYESFSLSVKFAETNNWLLYQDDDRLEMIIKAEGDVDFKEFLRNLAM